MPKRKFEELKVIENKLSALEDEHKSLRMFLKDKVSLKQKNKESESRSENLGNVPTSDRINEHNTTTSYKSSHFLFKCNKCRHNFGSKHMLINHMKENHPRYYTCKECEMRFNQSSELETHIVTKHNAKKNHKCEICNTEFVFKWRLNRHIEDHNKKVIRK